MSNRIQDAVYAIPVPAGLSARVLTACGVPVERKPARIIRFAPAAVTAVACAAVLLVTLLSTGRMTGATPPVTEPELSVPLAVPEQGEASTSTTAMTELATEPGIQTTIQNATTQRSQPTTSKGATQQPNGTVVGTTSGAQQLTTGGATTQTTWKGTTTTSSSDHAACRLVIPGRFVMLSPAELEAHYGRRYLPTRLPADMVQPEIYEERGIYYKDEAAIAEHPNNWEFLLEQGTIRDGLVIYDRNTYYWHSMEDTSRNLSVSVSTAPYPANLLGDVSRFDETLTVAGVSVKLHHYDDSPYTDTWCYSALAEVDGVAFYVSAWEFTREEFLDTLASLLE